MEVSGFGKQEVADREVVKGRCNPQGCPVITSGVGVTASAQQDGGDGNMAFLRG